MHHRGVRRPGTAHAELRRVRPSWIFRVRSRNGCGPRSAPAARWFSRRNAHRHARGAGGPPSPILQNLRDVAATACPCSARPSPKARTTTRQASDGSQAVHQRLGVRAFRLDDQGGIDPCQQIERHTALGVTSRTSGRRTDESIEDVTPGHALEVRPPPQGISRETTCRSNSATRSDPPEATSP